MSQKSNLRKQRKELKQEKQAKSVIKWIVISLSVLAVILLIYAIRS